jgi:hypothetical protein
MSDHKLPKLTLLIILFIFTTQVTVITKVFTTEQLVEDAPLDNNQYGCIKKLDNNNLVIGWYDNTDSGIYFQIFSAVGVKQGNNVLVQNGTLYRKHYIEALPNNKFIVLYSLLNSYIITGKIYNSDGTLSNGPFDINPTVSGVFNFIDITRLGNGQFVVSWAHDTQTIYYRFFGATGASPYSPQLLLNNVTTKRYQAIKAGPSNSFIICWFQNTGSSEDIKCQFYNLAGAVGAIISVASWPFPPMTPASMSVERLANGSFVIAYTLLNGGSTNEIYYAVIDSSNSVIKTGQIITGYSFFYPEIAPLTSGGFIITYFGVTCLACLENVYAQQYDASGNTVGVNNVVHVDLTTRHYEPSISAIDNDGYAIVWYSNAQYSVSSFFDIYFNVWYADDPNVTCSSFSVDLMQSSSKVDLDFATHIVDDYPAGVTIKISVFPTYGNVLLTNGSYTYPNIGYPYDQLTYNSDTNYGTFGLTYTAVDYFGNTSSSCSVTITVCYPSCQTCTAVGSNSDHMCSACRAGYLALDTSCFQTCPTSFGGFKYYPDIGSNSCLKCTSPCDECAASNRCVTCASGFLLIEDYITNNCQNSCPAGYYKSNTSCKKCDPLCTNCYGAATNCSACISTAFYIRETSQCVGTCPDGSAADTQSICLSCKDLNLYSSAGKCVKECPENEYPNTSNLCGICYNFVYKNKCYDSCPDKTFKNVEKKTCFTCADVSLILYNGICVQECPDGFINVNGECQTCSSQNMLIYKGKCSNQCPQSSKADDNGICIDTAVPPDPKLQVEVPVCSPTSCLNNGKCSISFNKISCACGTDYIGLTCQYPKASFDYNGFLSNIY